nr:YfhO family protein [Olegusella massiliensis]
MHLKNYLYLTWIALASFVLFLFCCRHSRRLLTKEKQRGSFEMLVLLSILILGTATILGNQILGTANLTLGFRSSVNDTFDQYIPYYLDIIHNAQAGALPFWSHHFGMGSSFLANQEWLMDPFNLVLIPLCLSFGEEFLAQAIAITFACRVLCAGFFFSHFLTRFCLTPLARIFGASSYAFAGYLFTVGKHYFFGTAWVLLPLIVLGLEDLMRRKSAGSFALVSVTTAIFICFSVYFAFMTLIFSPIYVALRLLAITEEDKKGHYCQRFLLCSASVLTGVLLSGVMLFPTAYYIIAETSRVGGTTASSKGTAFSMLSSFISPHGIGFIFSRLMGSALISVGTNYQFMPNNNELEFFQGGLGCGVYILLGQYLYWIYNQTSMRHRIATTLGLLFIAFYSFNFFFPSLITIFRYPSYRASLTIDAILICAMAIGLEKGFIERQPASIPLGLSILFSAFILTWSLYNTINSRLQCMLFITVLTLSILLIILFFKKQTWIEVLTIGLCVLFISSSLVDSFSEINRNPRIVPSDKFPPAANQAFNKDTMTALSKLRSRDDSFYRVERDFHNLTKWNDALSFNYAGISSYNSAEDGELGDFFNQLWPAAISHRTNNFSCYIFPIDSTSSRMMAVTGVRYLICQNPLPPYTSWAKQIEEVNGLHIYEISFEGNTVSPLYLRSSVLSQSDAEKLSITQRQETLDTSIIVEDDQLGLVDIPSNQQKIEAEVQLKRASDNSISGIIDTNRGGVACLSIPHTKGWNLTLDGKPLETFLANYGFIGFNCPAGRHVLYASYTPAGLIPGVLTSIAGTIFFVAFIVYLRKQRIRCR